MAAAPRTIVNSLNHTLSSPQIITQMRGCQSGRRSRRFLGEGADVVFDSLDVGDAKKANSLRTTIPIGIAPDASDENDVAGPVGILFASDALQLLGRIGFDACAAGESLRENNGALFSDKINGAFRAFAHPDWTSDEAKADKDKRDAEELEKFGGA